MKKLIRTGAMLFGACLVWAAGTRADGVRVFAAGTGDEAPSFAAGGETTDARGNSGAMLSLVSSGSKDQNASAAFGTHGYALQAMFHHSEGVGDDDDDGGSGFEGSNGGGSSGNCGHAGSVGGAGPGVVSTPEPSSLVLLLAGLLGLLSGTKAIRAKTA